MREQFVDSGRFLKSQNKKFLFVTLLFLGITVVTAVVMANQPDRAAAFVANLQEGLEHIVDEEGKINLFRLFVNNLSVAGLGVLFGFIPFIGLSLYIILTNGVVMGVMFGYYASMRGLLPVSPVKMLAVGILPHGILELAAIFMSVALGIHLCLLISKKLMGRGECPLRDDLTEIGWAFVLWVTPMLLVAAVIESYITPLLMHYLL